MPECKWKTGCVSFHGPDQGPYRPDIGWQPQHRRRSAESNYPHRREDTVISGSVANLRGVPEQGLSFRADPVSRNVCCSHLDLRAGQEFMDVSTLSGQMLSSSILLLGMPTEMQNNPPENTTFS